MRKGRRRPRNGNVVRSKTAIAALLRAAFVRVPAVFAVVLLTTLLASAFLLLCRYEQTRRGLGGVEPVGRPRLAYASSQGTSERIETEVALTFFETGEREITAPITWDDAWFAEDLQTYNHELARTCAVLSSLAYAESGYYQSGTAGPAYMEQALGSLGFDEVLTGSYRYRSEVVDQVLNVFTSEEDTVAYAVARKRVASEGETRSVIVVAVRGSYGAEWLSNLYLHDERSVAEGLEGYHQGYVDAADEIREAVRPMVRESHARGDAVTLVVTGHSRGGAVANLVAAMADDELAGQSAGEAADAEDGGQIGLSAHDAVCAYTFASPGCTTSEHARAERYDNIFNIVNPADVMPALPLATWGYARYGVDMELPGVDDEGFEAAYERFRAMYGRLVNEDGEPAASPYDPENAHVVQAVVDEVGERVGSVAELTTPGGIATVVQVLVAHVDPLGILCGHYQSVYVALMLALDAGDIAP